MLRFLCRRLNILLIILSFSAIGTWYAQGIQKGLDHKITYAFEHDAWSMSIALSRLVYGLHEGYVGYREVVRVMNLTLAPNGTHHKSSIPLLHDKAALNKALQDAISIPRENLPQYTSDLGGHFVTIPAEDTGFADFYTLAFSWFGFEADAPYNMYFLIFLSSALLFIWQFRSHTAALASLFLICGTFGVFFYSNIFDQYGMPSVNANRFASTLSIIPLLHLMWFAALQKKISWRIMIPLLLNALLFSLAISIRKTGQFGLILPIFIMLVIIWQARHRIFTNGMKIILFRLATLPALIGVGGFITLCGMYNIVQNSQLHDVYFSECSLPHHLTWHSIYLGLSNHPDWEIYNTASTPGAHGDNLAWSAFENHMKAKGEKFICSETGGLHKLRLHEAFLQKEITQFIIQYPYYIFELQFIHKPLRFIHFSIPLFASVSSTFWIALILASATAGILSSCIRLTFIRPAYLILLAVSGLAIVLLPFFIAYPNQAMADMLWMAVITLSVSIWALSYKVAMFLTPYLRPDFMEYPLSSPAESTDNGSGKWRIVIGIIVWLAIGFILGRASVSTIAPDQKITVVSATYGRSCGALQGNATHKLAEACHGEDKCRYKVDVNILGDAAPGCSKDYEIIWRCGEDPAQYRFTIPAEAGLGSTSLITCPPLAQHLRLSAAGK